jgi:hypothetical protein
MRGRQMTKTTKRQGWQHLTKDDDSHELKLAAAAA